MERIVLPELYCPFASSINVHAEAIDEATVDWARSFELLPGEADYRMLGNTGIGRLAARTHPDVPLNELQLISDWYAWMFFRDDMGDESEVGRHPGELSAADGRFLDVLEGAEPTDSDEPLDHALHDLRERLRERLRSRSLTDVRMRRFVRTVREHLEATLWEATNRALAAPPDLTSYLRMRPLTVGLSVMTELTEIIERTHLPTEVREHTTVRRLTQASHNVACWANDVLSLEKELKYGEVNNLVVVLRYEYGLTLQQAIDQVAEMHNDEVRTFVELAAHLPSFGTAAVNTNLGRYVSALRARMRGLLDWSHESGRYRLAAEDTVTVRNPTIVAPRR